MRQQRPARGRRPHRPFTRNIHSGDHDRGDHNAGQLIDSGSFRFSEQRTDQPIETSFSDAATQAIKPPSTPVEVVVDGVLHVQWSATPTPVGIRLDDPANEALLTEPDLLTGTVTDDSEQLVIGASDPIFTSSPANTGRRLVAASPIPATAPG